LYCSTRNSAASCEERNNYHSKPSLTHNKSLTMYMNWSFSSLLNLRDNFKPRFAFQPKNKG
jgi:hypothetical protein